MSGGTSRGEARALLKDIAARGEDRFDLAEAALALAALRHPGVSLDPYRAHLRELSDDAAAAAAGMPPAAADQAGVLADVLAGRHGYQGDDQSYEDLQNADLIRVIDRRRGLPVTLGILYIHAGRSQGWDVVGLNFPGHFLVRVQGGDAERVILDPFNGGQIMEAHDLRALLKVSQGQGAELTSDVYQPVTDRAIVMRLLNNIKVRHMEATRFDQALATITDMLLLAPDDPVLWRERGLMHMRTGDLPGAVTALEEYVARAPAGPDRERIDVVLRELRQRLQ
ncbi:Protein sirB1 [Caenispirillum salinarum AK4]|uniref:Protein sirB1 n=1 Tax=Caenispirillum salinarum AK4 TaxID=1238182 RepID=K9GWS8_9PROT|nr:transglutaminase-like domain-containing protein [Caenispirillum salinarum]EKV30455.1 Protein sirB1 [Caenispirillum salinarum AK4]